jgi:toxin ParE1/3/4
MSRRKTKIVLSRLAENDLANIAAWTAETYGQRQSEIYIDALLDTIDELSAGEPIHSKARDEIATGLRTLHMTKRGRRGRHLLVYKAADDILTIVRILHDSMEVSRHLPDPEG